MPHPCVTPVGIEGRIVQRRHHLGHAVLRPGQRLERGPLAEHPPLLDLRQRTADAELAESLEPIYEELPGWSAPTEGVVTEDDLPAEAKAYLAFLEEKIGAPAVIVSTGPRREETLVRGDSALADQLRSIISD